MSEQTPENRPDPDSDSGDTLEMPGITDDQLPEDLVAGEDNPLAEPLDPDDEATKSPDELEMDATQPDSADSETGSEESADHAGEEA